MLVFPFNSSILLWICNTRYLMHYLFTRIIIWHNELSTNVSSYDFHVWIELSFNNFNEYINMIPGFRIMFHKNNPKIPSAMINNSKKIHEMLLSDLIHLQHHLIHYLLSDPNSLYFKLVPGWKVTDPLISHLFHYLNHHLTYHHDHHKHYLSSHYPLVLKENHVSISMSMQYVQFFHKKCNTCFHSYLFHNLFYHQHHWQKMWNQSYH